MYWLLSLLGCLFACSPANNDGGNGETDAGGTPPGKQREASLGALAAPAPRADPQFSR